MAIKRLIDYYYAYWIDTITPEGFRVFQMPNRTNNLVRHGTDGSTNAVEEFEILGFYT